MPTQDAPGHLLPPRAVLAVVVVYAGFASAWILLSDWVLQAWILDTGLRELFQSGKGLLFVALTSALLGWLLRRLNRAGARHRQGALDAQQAELRTRQLLHAVADASTDAIFAKDLQGRYLLLNREASRATGVAEHEVLGRDDTVVFSPEQAALVQANDRHVLATGRAQTFEEEIDLPEGRRTFLATKGPLRHGGEVVGVFGISRDITEIVRTRRALEEAERRYRQLFKSSPMPMWVFDRESLRVLAVNQAAEAQYGWSREEFLGLTLFDLRPPEAHEALRASLHILREGQLPGFVRNGIFVHRRRDGSPLDVDITSHDLMFDGRAARLVMAQDVTERLQAERALKDREEALRLSEQRYRLAASSGHVWEWDAASAQLRILPAFWQRLGLPPQPDERTFPIMVDLMHPDDAPRWRAAMRAHLRDRQPYALDFRARHADGSWRWFHTQGQAVWNDQGQATYMAGITVDVTDQRHAEQALLQSELELSELAQRLLSQERELSHQLAQALHDRLGQLLGSARLHLDLAQLQQPGLEPLQRGGALLGDAMQEVRRVLALLRPPLLDDQGLAAGLEAEIAGGAGLGVSLSLRADATAREARWPHAVAYAAFMVAREALANALRHAQARHIELELAGNGQWLRLVVRDDGSGIAPEERNGRPGHLGIVGMRERALAIGARLEVEASASGGTEIRLLWGDAR